ncbi:MAG: glycosyltransferase family 2 protein [Bryobacteraceae bacterium]
MTTFQKASETLPVTVIVAVKNEAVNIAKCLASCTWAESVIVVDSHSSDGTRAISEQMGATVVDFDYRGGFPKKRQWAMDTLPLSSEWTLLLDADETVGEELRGEITRVLQSFTTCDAFLIRKEFHFLGKRFRFGGFSHSAVVLFRRGKARFERLVDHKAISQDMEIHERLIVSGRVGRLQHPLLHWDFKSLEAYIDRHNRYSTWDAIQREHFLRTGTWGADAISGGALSGEQAFRRFLKSVAVRLPFEPVFWFLYHYVVRLGFLEGTRGYIACSIRAQYIRNIRSKLFELRLLKCEREQSSAAQSALDRPVA